MKRREEVEGRERRGREKEEKRIGGRGEGVAKHGRRIICDAGKTL